MKKYNYFYTLLCRDSVGRPVSVVPVMPTDQMMPIINALIPEGSTVVQRTVLAELYINLLKTDAALNVRLWRIDPYNSYDITDYDITADPQDEIKLEQIADNIKKLQITTVRYTDAIGYILIALEYLLKLCEEQYD
jgi:predicted Rossmann fold nucleotide-binding protein DprA/Smf involved in DNA uptake